MKTRNLVLLAGVILSSVVTMPAQKKASITQRKVARAIDGHQAYKTYCTSCHRFPSKYSEQKEATILLHMRVRANLTEDETEAILRYLTK